MEIRSKLSQTFKKKEEESEEIKIWRGVTVTLKERLKTIKYNIIFDPKEKGDKSRKKIF